VKLRAGRREEPDVNLTPLIDVVFLLLIFFMVSTTFDKSSELSIELPEATATQPPEHDRSITVAIDAQGRYYVDGRRLVNEKAETLVRALKRVAGGRSTVPVVIDADARTPHQAVVTVMDAARELGLLHLRFATRLEQ